MKEETMIAEIGVVYMTFEINPKIDKRIVKTVNDICKAQCGVTAKRGNSGCTTNGEMFQERDITCILSRPLTEDEQDKVFLLINEALGYPFWYVEYDDSEEQEESDEPIPPITWTQLLN